MKTKLNFLTPTNPTPTPPDPTPVPPTPIGAPVNPIADPIKIAMSTQQLNPYGFEKADIASALKIESGWFIFVKDADVYGVEDLLVNAAITGISITDAELLDKQFKGLKEFAGDGFMKYTEYSTVDEYYVFSFRKGRDAHALTNSQIFTDESRKKAASFLLEAMLTTIHAYQNSKICKNNGYRSLRCFHADHAYVSGSPETGTPAIEMLPLPYIGSSADDDIHTDLRDAAYTYLQLRFPNGAAFDDSKQTLLAERCLSPFAQRRPTLNQLITELDIDTIAVTPIAPVTKSTPTGSSKRDTTNSPSIPEPDPTPSSSSATGTLKERLATLFARITSSIAGCFNKVSKAIKSLLDNAFSSDDDGHTGGTIGEGTIEPDHKG